MKANAIIRIVIWSFVTAALVGMLVLGLFPWLIRDTFLDDRPPAATAVPVPLTTEEVPLQVLPNEGALVFPAHINEIEIEWVSGDIIIMAKDVKEITISESDVSDEKDALLWKNFDHKLEILFCEEASMLDFGLPDTIRKDLYIEVPVNWEGRSIKIDAAAANVEMHGITVQEMDIDGADGTGDFQNCNISDLDIDTASGNVYYSGTLETLDFDAASAGFTADLQNTPSRIDMDSMDGTLDLALPEDCGFTLTMDGMSSRLASDFEGTSMKNGSHVYGDGRCRIDVDGMDCDVTLRKLESIITDPTEETK